MHFRSSHSRPDLTLLVKTQIHSHSRSQVSEVIDGSGIFEMVGTETASISASSRVEETHPDNVRAI